MSVIEKIQQIATGFQASSILAAGCELDLFTSLIQYPGLTEEEIAARLKLNLRALKILLASLKFLGFLYKKETNGWFVANDYQEILDSRHPQTMVPIICHWNSCQRQWSNLAWTVRSGVPGPKLCSINGSLGDYQAFINGMNSIAIQTADSLAEKLEQAGILNFNNMLDLGGATGSYSKAFLNRNLNAQAVVFDLPLAINEAKRLLKDSPLEKRISLVEGNFYRDELPQRFDFIWVSAIIHQQNNETTRSMFRKCWQALTKGGKIAIRDVLLDEDRSGPQAAIFFAVNMLCNTAEGKVYTQNEIFELLEEAGFKNPFLAVDSDDMSSVIVAEK
ncbi:MAG: methyltransferase [Planctomycetia bacterium]|nr:methyltransferase [Planctomycetia bacterium]